MPQVSPAEIPAGKAIAIFLDRAEIRLVESGFDVDRAFTGEGGSVSRDARWQNTIEHVHAARDQLNELRGCAQTHGIARLIRGKKGFSDFNRLHHLWFRLADAYSTDRVTVKFQIDQSFRAFFAQTGIRTALHDAKDE